MLGGVFGAHDGSVWRMPRALDARVEAALQRANMPGLDVRMQGQRAIVSGIVETEEDVEAARQATLTAAGAGGAWAGGITSVDVSGVSAGVFERPYAWSVRRDGNRVRLNGAVPSETSRERLMETARASFPNAEAIDEMRVVGGAPSSTFTDVARQAIIELVNLRNGQVRIVDNQIAVIGDGDGEVVDALQHRYASPPPPFRARLDLTIDGLDIANPELQGLDLRSGRAETCAQAFDRLLDGNVISFASGSAAIDPSSRRLLNSLASVALRCDRFTIEVSGHTDNQGARELNMTLSEARAEAVAAYLASQGVSRARLRAQGFGPDRPRAPNTTPSGQAQNRRIDFSVSG
ncbi:outer membrane protein [alpha proteobacterium U9-1i]|nr:outer membrane protein [alpha proteobacterium U9-1i]